MAASASETDDLKLSPTEKIADYVIIQNQRLTKRIEDVVKENYKLKTASDDLEKDVDRLNTSLKYLKGVVKNLNEINSLEKEMYSLRMTPFEQLQRLLIAFSSMFGVVNDMVIGLLFYLAFSDLYENLICSSLTYTVFIAFLLTLRHIIRKYNLFVFFNPDEIYLAKKTKLNELYCSQNFLSEYVDSL